MPETVHMHLGFSSLGGKGDFRNHTVGLEGARIIRKGVPNVQ